MTSPVVFRDLLIAAKKACDGAGLDELKLACASADRAIAEAMEYGDSIARARDEYCNDDVEIDDRPLISKSDNGVWVAAWVWSWTPEEDSQCA